MPDPAIFRLDDYREAFAAAGQGHVFQFADELNEREQARLAKDLSKVNLKTLGALRARIDETPTPQAAAQPAPMLELQEQAFPWTPHQSLVDAEAKGQALLREGKVAVIVVAGGQGTRLGFDEPKGLYPLWPKSHKLLFEGFAEQLRAIRDDYGIAPKLYIMTSSDTDEASCAAFMSADFFGLGHEGVYFFKQGKLPSLSPEGKLILKERKRIAFNPDGHGGVFEALKKRGALGEMRKDGVEWVYYFQVDNPFATIAEPAFIGAMASANAEVGIKAVRKIEASEKVGVIGLRDGAPTVVEYSELSDEEASAREDDGSLTWKAGNTAIHAFSFDFMQRVADGKALPLHRASKIVPFVNDDGEQVTPDVPNALKFERFIFDAFAQAKGLVNAECARDREFLPVKSADGPTSPAAVRQSMMASFREALKGLGHPVADDADVEIPSNLWADFARLKAALENGTFQP